ncbi:MAG: amidohydrolase [Chloroflexi bacterium]|nr:amidohydrolase [Chloroflexota bacterium]
MLIDIFPHILPKRYFDALEAGPGQRFGMMRRMRSTPVLFDLDQRFRIMDTREGYVQVLTLGAPPIEEIADPDVSPDLARLANDEMAALVERYPDRFPGFVASLPLNAPDAALLEIERAVGTLGATGVQVFTSVRGKPLDAPEFQPLFDRMAALDLPIWLHPTRPASVADYPGEPRSRYDIWWAFGWPYETSAAMARLVFSGLFERHADLKIITHHCGAMIPFCEGRIGGGLDQLGLRGEDAEDRAAKARINGRPIDHFRRFYGDTALFGATGGVECGVRFFGAERVLFGTDMPFDAGGGSGFIETIASIERARFTAAERHLIFEGNARRLLRLRG